MQIFINSVERLNSPVYSAPPCTFVFERLSNTAYCVCCLLVPENSLICRFIREYRHYIELKIL